MRSFTCLTWNIEGFHSNVTSLAYFLETFNPDMVFLSEPKLFQHDLLLATNMLRGSFSYSLNSEDLIDIDRAISAKQAHGGIMILWKAAYDSFITARSINSTAFLPIIFSPPQLPTSVHVAVYLPTAGKEGSFVEELAKLTIFIQNIKTEFPDCLVFLRGDFNVSNTNAKRLPVLNHFCNTLGLSRVNIQHPT